MSCINQSQRQTPEPVTNPLPYTLVQMCIRVYPQSMTNTENVTTHFINLIAAQQRITRARQHRETCNEIKDIYRNSNDHDKRAAADQDLDEAQTAVDSAYYVYGVYMHHVCEALNIDTAELQLRISDANDAEAHREPQEGEQAYLLHARSAR